MIGIVILNYENWDDTKRCIKSIFENPPKEEYKIILVDNASRKKPDADLIQILYARQISYVKNRKNVGYNAGNNVGIALALEAGCDCILISNNDICYWRESIQKMKDFLDRHPQTGIVGPRILNPAGRVQKSCLFCKTGLREKYMVRTRAGMLFWKSRNAYFGRKQDYDRRMRVHAVLGCCFMMSRRCAEAVTPLDEYPFLYEEELMLGIRMEEQGFATVYDPDATVIHIHGSSTKQRKAFAFAHNVRSEIYYCRKYLKAAKWKIYPLYCYRVTLYVARCFASRDFRRHWKWFRKITKAEMETFDN